MSGIADLDALEAAVAKRHLATLRHMRTTQQRREYLEGVERSDGAIVRKKLEESFMAEWKQRKEREASS